jgi:hypothetical protein
MDPSNHNGSTVSAEQRRRSEREFNRRKKELFLEAQNSFDQVEMS